MHIGIAGPIYIPSLKLKYKGDRSKWPTGMGGIPVNHLINSLIDLGYKISIFTSSTEIEVGNEFVWHEENISIFMGPFRKRARSRCSNFFAVERLYIKSAILKVNPDFIHAHWQYEWAWGALQSGKPTLVTCHDSPLHVLKAQPDFYRLFRLVVAFIVLKKAKYLTSVSPNCAERLKLFTSKKISIIPNFEPPFVFDKYKMRQIVPQSKICVCMINSCFTKLKNVHIGIVAFQKFRIKFPSAELHLFGESFSEGGEAYIWCKERNLLQNIKFYGHLKFEFLMQHLSTMTIFLHTSIEESFGMVLVEAMAMGIPVIAGKNSGGPDWILDNGGGILVNSKNVNAVYDALIKIVGINLYAKLSIEGRKTALERFSQQQVVNQYLDEYKKICKNK